jgi:hypothetical protein
MPWYFSGFRVSFSGLYLFLAAQQTMWIMDADDRYKRSLTWKPAVGTIMEHHIVMKGGGCSSIKYAFEVDGVKHTGDRFRSGSIHKEEPLSNPALLGAGTELVVYYNPADPSESAIKIQRDRTSDATVMMSIAVCIVLSYRAVRCETIIPNLFYRFLNANKRLADGSGLKQQRTHSRAKSKYATASQL